MRREDHDLIKDKSGEFVEILQCNNAASTRTPRGHQFPGAFLQTVSSDGTLQKSEVCTQLNALEKCFKIFQNFIMKKPM